MVVEYLSSKVFQIQIPTDFRGLIKWSPDEFLALSGKWTPGHRAYPGVIRDSRQNQYIGLFDDIPLQLKMKEDGKWVNCTQVMSICKNEAT